MQPQQPQAEERSQSRGRGFPERIQVTNPFHNFSQGATDIFQAAGQYPGQVAETLPSLIDTAAQRAGIGSPLNAIGQLPGVGPALGFAGEAIERTGNFVPALLNAQDARMLAEFGNKPDDFELPWWSGQRSEGVPILGAIPGLQLLFSKAKTVGELKRELEKRNFLVDPETGQKRSWQQMVAGLQDGTISVHDFGYASVNDNPLVDLAGRIALDPTNLLFAIPGANVVKGATTAKKVAEAVDTATEVQRILRPTINATAQLERAGLRAATLPAPVVAKEAVAVGDAANITVRGMSSYLKDILGYPTSAALRLSRTVGQRAIDPRGYLGLTDGALTATSALGRTGQAVARGARGYALSNAALSASLATTGNLAGVVDEALGGNTFFQGWHDFVLDVENNNPLSEHAAWMLASAFSFPYGDIARGAKAGLARETLNAFGSDFEVALSEKFGFGRSATARQQFREAIGGPEAVNRMIAYLVKHDASTALNKRPLLRERILSAPSAALKASFADETLAAVGLRRLRENKISGERLAEILDDWHSEQMGFKVKGGKGDQSLVGDPRRAPWVPGDALRRWKRYDEVQRTIGRGLQQMADGVLGVGLRDHLFREQFVEIRSRLRAEAGPDGVIPQDAIRSVLEDYPALAIADPTGYWKNAALPDAKPITWNSARAKLGKQGKHAMSIDEVLGESAIKEQRAAVDDAPSGVEPVERRIARLSQELEQHRMPRDYDTVWPVRFRVGEDVPADPAYVYHATIVDRAEGIVADRQLLTFEPWEFTDQSAWPDGAVEPRAYFADTPRAAASFFPEGGPPVLLRIRRDLADRESTGDYFTRKPVPLAEIEYLASDGLWRRLDGIDDNPRSQQIRAEIDQYRTQQAEVQKAKRFESDEGIVGKDGAKALSELDAEAALPEIPLNETLRGLDEQTLEIAREWERAILEIDPTYTVKKLPTDQVLVQMREVDPVIYAAVKGRTLLGELLFDRGPIAPLTGFMHTLFKPVKGNQLARDSRQALYQRLIPDGAKPEQVDRWVGLMQEAADPLSMEIRGQRFGFFRDVSSLLDATINETARQAFGPNSKIVQKWQGRFHDVLDTASSRMWRSVRNAARQGGKKGEFARSLESFHRFYLEDAAIVSTPARLVSKTFYHWFRFLMDPRWIALQLAERNFLGAAEDGIWRGSKQASRASQFYESGARRIDDAALHDAVDTGWYYGRGIMSHVRRSFDVKRIDSTETALNALGESDAARLASVRSRMRREAESDLAEIRRQKEAGERVNDAVLNEMERRANLDLENSNRDLADMLDQKMYDFDQKGVRQTIADEAQGRLDTEELTVLQPLLDVIYERNEQLWQDVNRVYHGNPERSSIERIANSYWLYWPISYQIKATKWLADAMLDGSFGHHNNALLAGKYAVWKEQHEERFKNNPAYAAMFEENPDLWFIAQMIFPITPIDIGVSLSRPVRLAGSLFPMTADDITLPNGRVIRQDGRWMPDVTDEEKMTGWAGIFGEYKQVQGPLSAAAYIVDLGPIYTWHMLQDLEDDYRGVERFEVVNEPEPEPRPRAISLNSSLAQSSLPAPLAPSNP